MTYLVQHDNFGSIHIVTNGYVKYIAYMYYIVFYLIIYQMAFGMFPCLGHYD